LDDGGANIIEYKIYRGLNYGDEDYLAFKRFI
jgi:hypothetical protein